MNDVTDQSVNGTDAPVREPSGPSIDDYFTTYRPTPTTDAVRVTIGRALAEIVHEAMTKSSEFVMLANEHRCNGDLAVQLGHLVDATECLEIAMTHLGQLKSTVSYRLRMQDEANADPGERPF